MTRFCYLLVIGWLWLPLMVSAQPMPAAQLTTEQQQWLAQHKTLRVGLVLQAPYAKFDQRLQQLSARLVALSPLAILERGYAIVLDPAGAAVRRPSEAPPGTAVAIRLAAGAVKARIEA